MLFDNGENLHMSELWVLSQRYCFPIVASQLWMWCGQNFKVVSVDVVTFCGRKTRCATNMECNCMHMSGAIKVSIVRPLAEPIRLKVNHALSCDYQCWVAVVTIQAAIVHSGYIESCSYQQFCILATQIPHRKPIQTIVLLVREATLPAFDTNIQGKLDDNLLSAKTI